MKSYEEKLTPKPRRMLSLSWVQREREGEKKSLIYNFQSESFCCAIEFFSHSWNFSAFFVRSANGLVISHGPLLLAARSEPSSKFSSFMNQCSWFLSESAYVVWIVKVHNGKKKLWACLRNHVPPFCCCCCCSRLPSPGKWLGNFTISLFTPFSTKEFLISIRISNYLRKRFLLLLSTNQPTQGAHKKAKERKSFNVLKILWKQKRHPKYLFITCLFSNPPQLSLRIKK